LCAARVAEYVLPASTVYTDDCQGYNQLSGKYRHSRIKHNQHVYVDGDVHTQAIEGFWVARKNGIRGSYHSVSKKHLQGYLNEYAWRYNHSDNPAAMFRLLLQRATSASAGLRRA
jgi:transposase-like protein